MTAVYWREDTGAARIRESKVSPIIWTAARIVGVYFDFREGAWVTYGVTNDARRVNEQRWEADTALASLCRAIREHESLSADPLLRYALLYLAFDYVTALWDQRR